MVCPRFAPFTGGTETHVAEVARRLADLDCQVDILTTDPRGELPAAEQVGPLRLVRRPTFPPGGDHFFSPAVARLIRRSRYDLVHMQGVHSLLAPLTMLAALRAELPYVVTFHTGGHQSRLRRWVRPLQWRALAPLLRRAGALIAVSQFERELFARALGIPVERIHLVPNGAELPVDPLVVEDPDLVLSVGRLEWYKGHHRAIAALPALARRRPGVRLRILGSGPVRQELLDLARRLRVDDRVSIDVIPPGDRTGMAASLASAALVVLLSEYEAHPVAVAEALALGRRVLVARTSGLQEIADAGHATGIALDEAPEVLAGVMDRAMGEPHPEFSQPLPSWDDCAAQIAAIYRSIVPAHPI